MGSRRNGGALEAARLMTYHSAWLSDEEGPTAATAAALLPR